MPYVRSSIFFSWHANEGETAITAVKLPEQVSAGAAKMILDGRLSVGHSVQLGAILMVT